MTSTEDLQTFIDALQEATLGPDRLSTLLRDIARAFDADTARLTVMQPGDSPTTVEVAAHTEVPPPVDAHREPVTIAVDGHDGTHEVTLTLVRYAGPAFDGAALQRVEDLRPHLPQAARLLAQLETAEKEHATVVALLDAIVEPFAVVDQHGRLVHANAAARAALDTTESVMLRDGVISTASERLDGELYTLIRDAARNRDVTPRGLALPGREPDRLGLVVRALPHTADADNFPLVAVHLTSPYDRPAPSLELLRVLFRLTPAEASLLQALAQGRRVEEHAQDRNVSVATVRTQLAHLFRKTGTNRQAELVRLALTATGAFRG